MKRIINGLTYNTETAEELARRDNGLGCDLKAYREILYLTQKGNLFIYREGGALAMPTPAGNNSYGGSAEIEAVSAEEAKEWYMKQQELIDIDEDVNETRFYEILGHKEIPA